MKLTGGSFLLLFFLLAAPSEARGAVRPLSAAEDDSVVRARTMLGLDATYAGRTAEAVEHMQWAYDYVRRGALTRHYYNASINVADALVHDGQLVEAATMLRRGLFYCDSLRLDASKKVPFYNTLSQIYVKFGDYTTAMRYSDDALALADASAVLDYASYWTTRGNVFYHLRRYPEAREAFATAVAVTQGVDGMDYAYHVALLNLQDVLLRLGEYDGLDGRLDSCEAFFARCGADNAIHYVHTLRAGLCLFRDGDLEAAGALLRREPTVNTDENLQTIRREILYHYYKRAGQKDSLIAILLAGRDWRDSLLNNVSAMRLADVELQFRESMREYEMAELHERTSQQRIFFIILALALSGLLLFLIYWMRSRAKLRRLELQQAQDRLMLERLRSTRRRLTPHYLMNLVRLVRSSDGLKTEQMAMTLRESLAMGDRIGVTLAEERRFVTSFLAFLPRSEGFRVVWEVDADVDPETERIPGMAVQLAVENAVKYAYDADYEGERLVRVTACRERRNGIEGLRLAVEDNGRGFGSHVPATSLGIPILTRTVSLLNLYNRHPLDMRIMDLAAIGQGHGVRVEYFFPAGTLFDLEDASGS